MKKLLVTIMILLFAVTGYSRESDLEVVKAIIKANNLDWSAANRVIIENGRIVALSLDNYDISKPGLKVLPPRIKELSELLILTLNDNDLTSLPKELLSLRNLVVLEAKNNNIPSLPRGISKLSILEELDLRNNELKVLPKEVASLKNLKKLQLWGNDLQSLPANIGMMKSLKELYLKGNKLIVLPQSIARLNLSYLDIFDNYLCEVGPGVDRWIKKYDRRYKSDQLCALYHSNKKSRKGGHIPINVSE